jgi:hypothetical protein
MATIATCRAENGKKPMLMMRFPVSWNLNSQIWHFEKIGRGLSASRGLIQKIYEVDPLTCPKCQGSMRVIAFIEDTDFIKKILKHLGLWEVKRKLSPRANGPPLIPNSYPTPSVDDYMIDPDIPVEAYF